MRRMTSWIDGSGALGVTIFALSLTGCGGVTTGGGPISGSASEGVKVFREIAGGQRLLVEKNDDGSERSRLWIEQAGDRVTTHIEEGATTLITIYDATTHGLTSTIAGPDGTATLVGATDGADKANASGDFSRLGASLLPVEKEWQAALTNPANAGFFAPEATPAEHYAGTTPSQPAVGASEQPQDCNEVCSDSCGLLAVFTCSDWGCGFIDVFTCDYGCQLICGPSTDSGQSQSCYPDGQCCTTCCDNIYGCNTTCQTGGALGCPY